MDIVPNEKLATRENGGQENTTYLFLFQEGCFGVFSWIKTIFCWFEQAGKFLTFVHIINQCSFLTCPKIAEWAMNPVSEAALMSFTVWGAGPHQDLKSNIYMDAFLHQPYGAQYLLVWDPMYLLHQPYGGQYLLVWDPNIYPKTRFVAENKDLWKQSMIFTAPHEARSDGNLHD